MAEEQDKSSKTEEPSSKRLDEARQSGNFARAEEIQVVFGLMAAFVVLFFYAKDLGGSLAQSFQGILGNLGEFSFNLTNVVTTGRDGLGTILFLLSPVCAAGVFGSVLAGGLQSGFRLSPKALAMKGKKLNPINGFKEKYGKQAYVKFCLDLSKLLAIAGVIFVWHLSRYPTPHFLYPNRGGRYWEIHFRSHPLYFGAADFGDWADSPNKFFVSEAEGTW